MDTFKKSIKGRYVKVNSIFIMIKDTVTRIITVDNRYLLKYKLKASISRKGTLVSINA